MKTQYQQPETGGLHGTRQRHARHPVSGLPELDTYKQLIQPNNHAGSSLFWGFPNTLTPGSIMNAQIIEDLRYLVQNASTKELREGWLQNLRDICSSIIEQATIQGGGEYAKSTT
jgi:hypothetical protein